jgi:hypothetical protein
MIALTLDRARAARADFAAHEAMAPTSPARPRLTAQWRRASDGRLIQTWLCASDRSSDPCADGDFLTTPV